MEDVIIEERLFVVLAGGREAGRHAFLIIVFFGIPWKSSITISVK